MQNLMGRSYDLCSFGDNNNWLSIQYESVNLTAASSRIRDIYIKAYQEVRAVLDDPGFKGDDVIWAGLAMDSLTKDQRVPHKKDKGPIQ